MKRALVAILILLIGIAIGSCLSLSHATSRPPKPDRQPVVGRRYERPGGKARTVLECWPMGVRYRLDSGREASCNRKTWERWVSERRED